MYPRNGSGRGLAALIGEIDQPVSQQVETRGVS
jgi:hypothetical protein